MKNYVELVSMPDGQKTAFMVDQIAVVVRDTTGGCLVILNSGMKQRVQEEYQEVLRKMDARRLR